ncbi:hypothetical protein L6164_032544 [Bauhinia variegata]|uniref:Uncharacterized protein n=1 Tax=Bauhinia variegata TaxID=167791 RepID=A0ACB9KP54_BAUVA|nr:hypothetical protein L6164_032544 [Bauhinia variegata]
MKPLLSYKRRKVQQQQNPNNVQSERVVSGDLNLHNSEESNSAGKSVPSDPLAHKKTRDLPNLNECHACGFKVDVCNGKNGLQTLYSEWRIVLLCKKCYSSVESSQVCSYCFTETSAECFRCPQCKHSVHKKCLLMCKNDAPWSYCLGKEFSVCVDCWIPESIAISRRRLTSKKVSKRGRVDSKVLDSRISAKPLQDVVKDANHKLEKKFEAADRARGEAVKKATVARRAIELENNALDLVGNGDENSLNECVKTDSGKIVDDAEKMKLELYPAVNSSPRNSKNCCLLNSSNLDTPKICASSINSSCKTSDSRDPSDFGKHEVSDDSKLSEDSSKYEFEPSVCISALDRDSSTDMNHLGVERTNDKRVSPKDGDCIGEFNAEGDIGKDPLYDGEGSCSNRLIHMGRENSSTDLHLKQGDSAFHGEGRCNGQPDRFFLTYRRRACRLISIPDGKPEVLYNGIHLESQGTASGVPSIAPGN